MKCPVDNVTLQITNRDGIEVDYCPDCRGVWLDRGELDKIIERNGSGVYADSASKAPQRGYDYDDDDDYRKDHYPGGHGYHKKKRKSFLEDIFDF